MKKWYKSKTVLVNASVAALVGLEASLGTLKPLLGENSYALVAALLPVVNIFLRVVTTEPIKEPKG